ncbi:hypothetical protein [Streptomyces boninensis]|uniref:hypothetical protein n=1 Tax=Streptomyces boninensis TaxID=2039455 RepID=UPI003B222CF2
MPWTPSIRTAAIFAEYVELGLGDSPSRQMWKDLMSTLSYFFQSEAAQQVRAEGREEGRLLAKAEGVLSVLEHRGVSVPATVHERVLACTDIAQLDVWWNRAFTISDATALFRSEAGDDAGEDEPADIG